jgi:hypothetical protein
MSDGYALLVFECAWCNLATSADPDLVMCVDSYRDREGRAVADPGAKHPLCEGCARQALDGFHALGMPTSPQAEQLDYFERAYHPTG